MKKYELTSDTKETKFGKVYRIRALKAFGNVKAGDYGGWISSEHNLAQEGNCWVYDEAQVSGSVLVCDNARVCGKARVYGDACVFDDVRVYDNAQVYDHALVYGNAKVFGNAWVSGRALLRDNAQVYGTAHVYDDAWVRNNAQVYGDAWVFGDAQVYDEAQVFGFARVHGEARISQLNDILTIGAIGSRDDWTTVHKDARIGARISCSCFTGSLDEFAAKVRETHGNNIHTRAYNALIELARVVFADALTGSTEQEGGSA
jgi:carbonic anhydrase/acetyltransferase-like protein (isoleucine patch superfamily)